MERILDLLTIALLPGVGPRAARDLLARGALSELLSHPDEHRDLLAAEARSCLGSGEARRRAESERALADRLGIQLLGLGEQGYPERLAQIYDPPPVLYVRGSLLPGEGERALAIVGSRAASPQGSTLARALGRDLAAAGLTIVSGLARGIDGEAHRGALDAGGRTIAVLGSGIDRIYPEENEALAAGIAGAGAVVSEFPLGTPPRRQNFPRRNRLIAGWGRGVVVVEAAERSGALVTARAALEEGREVLAVPGHPSHPGAGGTNALIRDGAVLVRSAADVLGELGLRPALGPGPGVQDEVLRALRPDAPTSLEDLQARCGRALPDLLARLSELEIGAKVRRLPGLLFVRS